MERLTFGHYLLTFSAYIKPTTKMRLVRHSYILVLILTVHLLCGAWNRCVRLRPR